MLNFSNQTQQQKLNALINYSDPYSLSNQNAKYPVRNIEEVKNIMKTFVDAIEDHNLDKGSKNLNMGH